MRLINRAGQAPTVFGFVGAGSVVSGLYGLWGWPAAALFAGAFLLTIAVGLSLARKL